jgi:hypothetical protein
MMRSSAGFLRTMAAAVGSAPTTKTTPIPMPNVDQLRHAKTTVDTMLQAIAAAKIAGGSMAATLAESAAATAASESATTAESVPTANDDDGKQTAEPIQVPAFGQFTTYASIPSIFLHRFALADAGLRPMDNLLRSVLETGDVHDTAVRQRQPDSVDIRPDSKQDRPYNPNDGTIAGFVAAISSLKSSSAAVQAAVPTDVTNESWFVEFLEIQATRAFFRSSFVDHDHRFERAPDRSIVGTHRIDLSFRKANTGPTMMPVDTKTDTKPDTKTAVHQQNYDELLRRLDAPANPVGIGSSQLRSAAVHRFPLDMLQYDRQAFCVRCGTAGTDGGRQSFPACPNCGIRNACIGCLKAVHVSAICGVVYDLVRRGVLRTRYRFMPDADD